VDCVEIQPDLAAGLEAEGIYNRVICTDFLSLRPQNFEPYDLVVMNPPFDRERDVDHVTHALEFLKPGGSLFAIMSAGTEFRETRKAVAFRALVERNGGHFRDLPPGSFRASGTNVNTCIVTMKRAAR
jgi:type I restriction-modification system DNA methylase subunit